jgi:hypothetical protein
MALELPNLPYDYDALAPYMSRETLEFHHDKHHQAYVTKGNELLEGSAHAGKSIEDICKAAFAEKNAGPDQQCRPALQPSAFLELDEEGRRRFLAAGRRSKRRSIRISAALTSSAPTSSPPASASSAPAGPGSPSRTASSK